MTTTQRITGWFIAFTFGVFVPLASFPLIDKCSPIGDANFWLPFVSISCPVELFGQVGCFIIGFVFTATFFVAMAVQLLFLGALHNLGIISVDTIGTMGNSVLVIPLFVGLITNTVFYWTTLRHLFSIVRSRNTKLTAM